MFVKLWGEIENMQSFPSFIASFKCIQHGFIILLLISLPSSTGRRPGHIKFLAIWPWPSPTAKLPTEPLFHQQLLASSPARSLPTLSETGFLLPTSSWRLLLIPSGWSVCAPLNSEYTLGISAKDLSDLRLHLPNRRSQSWRSPEHE